MAVWNRIVLVGCFTVVGGVGRAEDAPRAPASESTAQSKAGDEVAGEVASDCERRSSYGCALYPIQTYPTGTLYYAEYYNPTCDAQPTPTYLFGDYPWPWSICPDDCGEGVYCKPDGGAIRPAAFHATPDFGGLPEGVPCDYMHRRPTDGSLVHLRGQRASAPCFPGGPAQKCCRVNPQLNCLFVDVTKLNEPTKRFAKVLQLEVNLDLANLKPDRGVWTPTYVAFETEDEPQAATGHEIVPAFQMSELQTYVRSARFRRAYGRLEHVLILLKQ